MRTRYGFTLIELMVALVVAGVLMAGLVALSGSVRRSFGRSQDITEVQADLRFAMRMVVDDVTRAGYMYSLDPTLDNKQSGPLPASWIGNPEAYRAIAYRADTRVLSLRGNFVASRDYRVRLNYALNQATILCRDGNTYDTVNGRCPHGPGGNVGGDENNYYMLPFYDGPSFEDLFCNIPAPNPPEIVRLNRADSQQSYSYLTVNGVGSAVSLTVNFSENITGEDVQGCDETHPCWISPVTTVQYQVVNTGTRAPSNAVRWVLQRSSTDCRELPMAEIGEFLLPPDDPDAPGLELQVYHDVGGAPQRTLRPARQPAIDMENPVSLIPPDGNSVDWLEARALAITLRARTEVEDPNFFISTYTSNPAQAKNFGFDLDGNPDNGLAHVRVEHTLIELRNVTLAANR